MKKAFAVTLLSILMTMIGSNLMAQSGKDVQIELTKKSTREEVEALVQDLERRLIKLEFDEIAYSKAGKLRKVKGTITFKDGAYGTFVNERLFMPNSYVKIVRKYNSNGVAGRIQIDVK